MNDRFGVSEQDFVWPWQELPPEVVLDREDEDSPQVGVSRQGETGNEARRRG